MNDKFAVENNIVTVDEDGFHRMDYEKIIVPMVRAVQELSDELVQKNVIIAHHEASIAQVQRELKEVREQLQALLAQNKASP